MCCVSFCYSIVQSLQTSPYLPFSVYVQGTLSVSTTATASFWGAQYGTGYQVVDAIGTRTVQVQGKPAATANIVGVAAIDQYSWNDNLIQLTGAPLTQYHSLSFKLDSTAQFAGGPAVSPQSPTGSVYFNIQNFSTPVALGAAFQESDNPLNDGETVVITSQFSPLVATTSWANSYSACPIAAPATITVPSTVLTAFAARLQYSFCYTFSSGSGYGTLSGGLWQVAGQGTFTSTAYTGTTVSGRAAQLLVGVTGTRTFSLNDIVSNYQPITQTVTFTGLLSPNGGRLQNASVFINGLSNGYGGLHGGAAAAGWYANNVYYPNSWPWLDAYGAQILTSGGVEDEVGSWTSFSRAITSSTSIRLLVANIGVEEQAIDFSTASVDVNYDASFLQAAASSITPDALAQQCSPSQPNLQTYQYAINNT